MSVLEEFATPMMASPRGVLGREREVAQILAGLARPEVSNVLLLGPAGAGKTSVVQEAARLDSGRDYLEVDLSRLIADRGAASGAAVKEIFDDAQARTAETGREVVLFLDEFHQLVQLSPAAVEAVKPVLAASGARGLRMIAATTFEEFQTHIAPNQPLVERLQRVNLSPPSDETVVAILEAMARRYEVEVEPGVLESIVELTNRYQPASVQPRKAILVLDAMTGWHRTTGAPMGVRLLAEVLEANTGVRVSIGLDATKIKQALDKRVLSQHYATSAIADRLQLCVADLNDPTKPLSSFLFGGSTGVGKGTVCSVPIPVWTSDGSVSWKRADEIQIGDHVFSREGLPEKVLGVFPQGMKDVYRVTFADGRSLDVDGSHLWAVYLRTGSHENGPTVYSTETLFKKGVGVVNRRGSLQMFYEIPMNQAVRWPQRELPVDPYVVGVFIGNGCLTNKVLDLSSGDEFVVAKVADLLGASGYDRCSEKNYNWVFSSGLSRGEQKKKRLQTADVFAEIPTMVGAMSQDKRIPTDYMTASIEQRWDLVRGLFDTDGHIGQSDGGRFNVSYSTSSERLAQDVSSLLFSLGVSNTIGVYCRSTVDGRSGADEYHVRVKSVNDDKVRFFSLPRKLEIAERAATVSRERVKTFDYVGIRSIELIGEAETVCLYVDDDEHLYQAGEFVVTHNTELTKALAELLFGDDRRHLIRFDMSEYALAESMGQFRSELTSRVWAMGHGVVLLDEVEKANGAVVRLLLQVLDDGRLTDDNGRQVSFLNCYFVLTTNAGAEIFRVIGAYDSDDAGSGDPMRGRMREIRRSLTTTQSENRFPPELLGRIDAIVPFQPLSTETIRGIVTMKLRQLRDEVRRKHGVEVQYDRRVVNYLVDDRADSDSDAGGARAAVGLLISDVAVPVAARLNAEPGARGLRVWVDGVLRSEDKTLLDSSARVAVTSLGPPSWKF